MMRSNCSDCDRMADSIRTLGNTIMGLRRDNAALLEALQEFIQDVEAVGVEQAANDWPDMVITYRKARAAIRQAEGD